MHECVQIFCRVWEEQNRKGRICNLRRRRRKWALVKARAHAGAICISSNVRLAMPENISSVLSSSDMYSHCYWYFSEGYLGLNVGSTASLSPWTPRSVARCTASWAVLRVCSHCISFEASEARNRQSSNGILSCVWAALPCLTLRSEDLSCDSANLHTVTGPSAHHAVFIVHRVVGSPVLQRKWTRPVDLVSVGRFGAHPPLQGSDVLADIRFTSDLIPQTKEAWF